MLPRACLSQMNDTFSSIEGCKVSRNTEGIFAFVRHIGKGLFGLAARGDGASLAKVVLEITYQRVVLASRGNYLVDLVNNIGKQQQEVMQHINEVTNAINYNRNVINLMQCNIKEYTWYLSLLERRFRFEMLINFCGNNYTLLISMLRFLRGQRINLT